MKDYLNFERMTADVNISYQYSFSIYDDDNEVRTNDGKTLRNRIKSSFKNVVFYDEEESTEEQIFKDIKTSENFLHGGGLPFECFRAYIKDYKLSFKGFNIVDSATHVTLFPESDTVQVFVCLSIKDCPIGNLIYLRHVRDNGAKFTNLDGREISAKEIFEQISGCLNRTVTDIEEGYLIEIKRFGDFADVQEVIDYCPAFIYGLISGDEGYVHVPRDMAVERLSNCWGSRTFIRLISFGGDSVFFNFSQSAEANEYRERRKVFDSKFYGDMNPYFLIDSNYAGVNHGILFAMETSMAIKTICTRIIRKQSSYYSKKTKA